MNGECERVIVSMVSGEIDSVNGECERVIVSMVSVMV